MTTGDVQVDGSLVRNNSAIFPGSIVASGRGIAMLRFADGVSATLSPSGIAKVFSEHSILLHGAILQNGIGKHVVFADGLRISGEAPDAIALVGVKDASHVEVASQTGKLHVTDADGALVATIDSGQALDFARQTDAANQDQPQHAEGQPEVDVCGKLQKNDQVKNAANKKMYLLKGKDAATQSNIDSDVGRLVRASGTVPSTPQPAGTSVLSVDAINVTGDCPGKRGNWITQHPNETIFFSLIAATGIVIGVVGTELPTQPITPITTPITPSAP
ncbi:MAG: hypothetical protein FWD64_00150 [Acidobacteriaceae bacterium]|nr:hypothetical protein [Acidobacteriaceae bacterium]